MSSRPRWCNGSLAPGGSCICRRRHRSARRTGSGAGATTGSRAHRPAVDGSAPDGLCEQCADLGRLDPNRRCGAMAVRRCSPFADPRAGHRRRRRRRGQPPTGRRAGLQSLRSARSRLENTAGSVTSPRCETPGCVCQPKAVAAHLERQTRTASLVMYSWLLSPDRSMNWAVAGVDHLPERQVRQDQPDGGRKHRGSLLGRDIDVREVLAGRDEPHEADVVLDHRA